MVESVVRHWVEVMVEGAEERGDRGQEGRHHTAFFYADNGIVASSEPQWIHVTFSTLVGLFDRVGLRTNIGKTSVMVCFLCQAEGNQSEVTYKRRMKGEGPYYREWQKGRVQCRE